MKLSHGISPVDLDFEGKSTEEISSMFGGDSQKPKGGRRRNSKMRDIAASQRNAKHHENEEIEL